jgi:hypothetical protein
MVDGGTLANGKMFLDLNQEQAAKTRGVLGIGGDPNTTAIRQVTSGEQKAERWYTLDGRRLPSPPVRKGIYIKNGEKIVVK